MGDVNIDVALFCKRVKVLHDNWLEKNKTLWGGSTALAIVVGASSDDLRYLKSISLHLWLFGYELPDTILIHTQEELHLLTSQKKANLLEPLVAACEAETKIKMVLHIKAKQDDGSGLMADLISTIKETGNPAVVGVLPKEKHEGSVADLWSKRVAAANLTTVDVGPGLSDLFAIKDAGEILAIKKAALLAAKVMKDFVVPKIEQIIDQGKSVKHQKLMELTEEVITDPSKVQVKLKSDNVDIAYSPIFQSGGKYDLRVSSQSDEASLHDGVVVVALGTRYTSYCANISRTYIINPTKQQEAEYNALLEAEEAIITNLKDGTPISKAVQAAMDVLSKRHMDHLIANLGKSMGFGMGLEFRDSALQLTTKNETVVRAGMVLNVCIGVSNLVNDAAKDPRGKNYAIQIADTVVVREKGQPGENATQLCPRTWDKISYTLNEDEDDEDGNEEDAKPGSRVKLEEVTNKAAPRKALRADDPNFKSAEQERKERQEQLLKQKNEETLRRLTAQNADRDGAPSSSGNRAVSSIVTYRSPTEIPASRDLLIQVDNKAEAVLLPIYGVMVPFHITTIKNVASNQDNEHAYVRVTFNFNGAYEPAVRFPSCIFLKELSFRCSDVRHASKVVQDIKLLRSSVTQRDKERAERATLVEQEALIKGKKVFRLPDLWIRPALGGKGRKIPGTLEAHANGFRYSNPKGETCDIMYRNIKHAIFQPAEKEMITILHFHLTNPIMVNKKKTKDVQVYAEVMDVVQTLDTGRKGGYDPDEIEEEQRERERRNRVKMEFQQFIKRVQEVWDRDFPDLQLEFDIPYNELGFHGAPHRSSVFIMPTVNCLVELTEMPFLVVTLSEIEIVNLERVGFNLKNFDMAIVFKDFSKDVMRIDAIPSKSLEQIREWLNNVSIKFYESKLNLAWKPILKNIVEDPVGFFQDGGWSFLDVEKSDSEEEEEEQSDDFVPGSEGSEESEDDDDSSDDESLVDSDDVDDEDDDEGDEDESEGLDWDEMEQMAEREDRQKDFSDDSEDERRARKRKGSASAAPKKRR